jgi:multimeric flavodoxin WrbA
LLEQVCDGYREAGGSAEHIHCARLLVKPCQACGPEPTSGYCIFHDDMDHVYARLEQAHALVVGSPIYFDSVSAQLKLVIDRCNCVTPLVRLGDGTHDFRPKWARTRRGVFVTAHSPRHPYEMAERCVRGFMKWVGVKWEETLDYAHADEDLGSVSGRPEWLERARAIGRRLASAPPLEVEASQRP